MIVKYMLVAVVQGKRRKKKGKVKTSILLYHGVIPAIPTEKQR
jgi:hypothetical protein